MKHKICTLPYQRVEVGIEPIIFQHIHNLRPDYMSGDSRVYGSSCRQVLLII